jgi:uncharacterized BrkB/YihY/UPF0761 family membrane protein
MAQKPTRELVREVTGEVAREVRRHDLPFYAAGLTFHAAIAVVPPLLVAWFVTSLVLGDEVVGTLTLALGRTAAGGAERSEDLAAALR